MPAEALLDIYSRVGIPEEVLTDQGTQFMSECMQEVSRLLSIKGLTSTPYHPICNGLVERWNGTLKSMLKRLCQDQPKQWHRLINPVLFAYREVPQESTGFSPFQLLYGRSVKGPGTILKELWTKEVNIPEVKSSYVVCYRATRASGRFAEACPGRIGEVPETIQEALRPEGQA